MSKYNGHKNWNHWNVSLWINNDQGLYMLAKDCLFYATQDRDGTKAEAAKRFLDIVAEEGTTHTPDGAPYSVSSIRAAMVGM